jgi:proteasome lid subunit RPN8/RPN11
LSNRYVLLLSRALHDEIIAHARAESPNECCGFLAGTIAGPIARSVLRLPLINAADQPRIEYLSESRSILKAHQEMRARGIEEVAVYHSHPTTDPIPSRKDCASNTYADFLLHLIISLKNSQPAVRAWWLLGDRFEEGKWEFAEDGGSE